jgi:predicted Zn-dependent protease
MGVLTDLVGLGGRFMTLQFSRDNEREADALGAEILDRAGLPQLGLALFFERMGEWERERRGPGAASGSLDFLRTHPATTERKEWAQALVDKEGVVVPEALAAEFRKLKEDVAAIPAKK